MDYLLGDRNGRGVVIKRWWLGQFDYTFKIRSRQDKTIEVLEASMQQSAYIRFQTKACFCTYFMFITHIWKASVKHLCASYLPQSILNGSRIRKSPGVFTFGQIFTDVLYFKKTAGAVYGYIRAAQVSLPAHGV